MKNYVYKSPRKSFTKSNKKINFDIIFNKEKYGTEKEWKDLKTKCKKRDNYTCQKCGFKPNKDERYLLHADHIVPLTKGGKNNLSNLQTLCYKCHERKTNLGRPLKFKVKYEKKNENKSNKFGFR